MKTEYKVHTPEEAFKMMKRREVINWTIFFGVLLLMTIGILEILSNIAK